MPNINKPMYFDPPPGSRIEYLMTEDDMHSDPNNSDEYILS
jgi:hypothetical protein